MERTTILIIFGLIFCLPAETISSSGLININTASAEELQLLVGIGPVMAQSIIETRPFYSLDELTKVSRIGPKTLEKIKEQGLAWVDPELKSPQVAEQDAPERLSVFAKEPLQTAEKKISLRPLTVFLIALSIAGFSGRMLLALKKKLKIG